MKRLVSVLCVLYVIFLMVGCATHSKEHRHAPIVRSGILKKGINKQAFLDVWGEPDRARTAPSEEFMSAGWSGSGGGFFKGRKTLEVWSYEKIGIELIFDGDSLAGWKTDKTVQQLKAEAKPLPK